MSGKGASKFSDGICAICVDVACSVACTPFESERSSTSFIQPQRGAFLPPLQLHFRYCCIFIIHSNYYYCCWFLLLLLLLLLIIISVIIILNFVQSNGKTLEALEYDAFGGSQKTVNRFHSIHVRHTLTVCVCVCERSNCNRFIHFELCAMWFYDHDKWNVIFGTSPKSYSYRRKYFQTYSLPL